MSGIDPISNIASAVEAGSGLIRDAIDKIWPSETEKAGAEATRITSAVDAAMKVINAQVAVIVAEAQGAGVLQRNWRPITMLTFLAMIVGHFFGFEGPNFTADDSMHLFNLVELGLGGYVIGRSAEKIVPQVADIITKARK